MHQYSSLPGQNSQVDATPKLLTMIQQLQAELWLERSLNRLQNSLNECLISFFTSNQPIAVTEAKIFRSVLRELKSALTQGRVAIALVEPQQTVGKICYVASNPSRCSPLLLLDVMNKREKKLLLKLKQEIDIEDLQLLQEQKPPNAWHLADDAGGSIGWLIVATASCQSNCELLKDTSNAFTPQLMKLIAGAAKQCATAIAQLRHIQSLQQHCQQLERFNQELERTNQLKNQFLANTSHEIRTPLSSIIGFTHLLLAQGYDPGRERHQEYLNIIQSSGKHLLGLINDILDLSKIEANQLEMQLETVDVPTLCRNVLILVKEKAANKGLKLILELDLNVSTLIVDPLRLKQMLLNLLLNAVKFTNHGNVGLRVMLKDSFMHFTVWDTGSGISKQHQTELFQPYFQITNTGVSREEGTGLGLAVTRKLAELHGGRIEVESEVNSGSYFTIVLPLRQPEEEGTHPLGEAPSVAEGGIEEKVGENTEDENNLACCLPLAADRDCANILLVENDLANAQLIKTYLENLRYQVTWVKNAAEMWEVLKQLKPNVILLDVQLPDENGLTLVKQLQAAEQYQTIPVIIQTAMAMKGDREICLATGVDDYISKPIDLPLLASLVSRYCNLPT